MQKYRGEPRRGPSAAPQARRGAGARLFSSWKIVKDRRARAAVSRAVVETTNTSNSFHGLRLSPRLVAARSKDPIVRFVRVDSISARGILPEKL